MSKQTFLACFSDVLTDYERHEIQNMAANSVIYYAGDIPQRTFKFQSHRMRELDDEEGYYLSEVGDHILYRYQILKILGKGSFAEVVSALDHATGARVALKINRNTEIDHQFAAQEANLLKFLMKADAQDQHNIVRMMEHVHFRDHQCLIFELLHTNLFDNL